VHGFCGASTYKLSAKRAIHYSSAVRMNYSHLKIENLGAGNPPWISR